MERTFSRLMNKLETKGAADILKYASVPGVIPLSAGSPSQEAFPTKELAEIAAAVFREEAVTALQYNPTEGYPPLRAFLPGWLKEKYGVGGQGDALVALTIGVTMACTVIIAKVVGCTLPLVAKRVGLDPAIMATPLISTLVDISTISVYFAIVSYVFHL